jgi:hypothetical protein
LRGRAGIALAAVAAQRDDGNERVARVRPKPALADSRGRNALPLARHPEAAGYRWEPGELARRGAWCTEVAEEAFEAECAFLRDDIYRGKDAAIDARLLTAFERYSVRSVG